MGFDENKSGSLELIEIVAKTMSQMKLVFEKKISTVLQKGVNGEPHMNMLMVFITLTTKMPYVGEYNPSLDRTHLPYCWFCIPIISNKSQNTPTISIKVA